MIGQFPISIQATKAAILAQFIRAYPGQYALLGQVTLVPVYDDNEDFDGFLLSAEIQEKEGV